MDLKNSQTAHNLLKAFAGESQARNRYTMAASIAKKEGFQYIASVFEETAANEKEHATLFFRHLGILAPGALEITASYPIASGDTIAQLESAYRGENEEWAVIYPEFSRVAQKEGFNDIARTFEWIAKVEKDHEARFYHLLTSILNGTTFQRSETSLWRCLECGYIHEYTSAPKICPVCSHPQAYFAPIGERF